MKLGEILRPIAIIALVVFGLNFIVNFIFLNVISPSFGQEILQNTSWIKEERKVIVQRGSDLYLITLSGKSERKIAEGIDRYYPSPDGSKLALWNRAGGGLIRILNIQDGAMTLVKQNGWGTPKWTPNGQSIFYDYDNSYPSSAGIEIFDIATKTAKRVNQRHSSGEYTQWSSADGRRLFLMTENDKCYQYELSTEKIMALSPSKPINPRDPLSSYVKDDDLFMWTRPLEATTLDGKISAITEGDGIWLKSRNGEKDLLVKFTKPYNPTTSGWSVQALSNDAKYMIFEFRGRIYVCDTKSKKTGYLTTGNNAQFAE